jgi:hypothetical protein
MKFSEVLTIAVAAANVASASKFLSGPGDWVEAVGFKAEEQKLTSHDIRRRQTNRAVAPKRQDMKTRNPHIPNSKTVKIRYGPYTVPGARAYVFLRLPRGLLNC